MQPPIKTGEQTETDEQEKPLSREQVMGLLNEAGSSDKLNLRGRNLNEIDLSGLDLSGADLRGVHLSLADLSRILLSGADLSGADLTEADLTEADLSGAILDHANLNKAILRITKLHETNLRSTNLSEAILIGSTLTNANLFKTNLSKAYISNPEKTQLQGKEVIGLYQTKDEADLLTVFSENIILKINTDISRSGITEEVEAVIKQTQQNAKELELEDQAEELEKRARELEDQAEELEKRIEELKLDLETLQKQYDGSEMRTKIALQKVHLELEDKQEKKIVLEYHSDLLQIKKKQLALQKVLLELEFERVNLPYNVVQKRVREWSSIVDPETKMLFSRILLSPLSQLGGSEKERVMREGMAMAVKDMERQMVKQSRLSLLAIVRVDLGKEQAVIGETYQVHTGVGRGSREIDGPISLDIFLHASENIELPTGWHKHLTYDPLNPEPQFTDFAIYAKEVGQSTLVVDFYSQRCWLKTLQIEFESIKEPAITVSSN